IFNSNTTMINRRIASRHNLYVDITVQVKLDATAFSGGLNVITAFEPEVATITDWFIADGTAVGFQVETSIDSILVSFDVGGSDIRSIRYDISCVFSNVCGIGCDVCRIRRNVCSVGLNIFSHDNLATLDRSNRTINTTFASTTDVVIGKGASCRIISRVTPYN